MYTYMLLLFSVKHIHCCVPAGILASKKAVVEMFFHAFMHENALNPMVFPSLRTFETEVQHTCSCVEMNKIHIHVYGVPGGMCM